MSYILTKDNVQVAIAKTWHPRLFGEKTGTSYPAVVDTSYEWGQDGYLLRWEDDPAPEPLPPQPIIVTPRQIRQALTIVGIRETLEAAVGYADQNTKDWWNYATSFEENHEKVVTMATWLGVDATALHELFVLEESL